MGRFPAPALGKPHTSHARAVLLFGTERSMPPGSCLDHRSGGRMQYEHDRERSGPASVHWARPTEAAKGQTRSGPLIRCGYLSVTGVVTEGV
jgi:hypothetical protein